MSELIIKRNDSGSLRVLLLTTASAFVLVGAFGTFDAKAEDAGKPTVWFELGGQLERIPGSEERIAPSFALRTTRPDFETVSPISLLRAPRYAAGGEGRLSFEPAGSNWVFSAAVRYGRSNGKKHFHNQTYIPSTFQYLLSKGVHTPGRFEDVKTKYDESHTIVDFTVGRDVGLGLFGNSVASFGVRYAQFGMSSDVGMSSKPDFIKIRKKSGSKYYSRSGFHNYIATSHTDRNFHGVGPSLSFSGVTPFLGREDGALTFDWGVNGALLYGRQYAAVDHRTYGRYKHVADALMPTYHRTDGHDGSHSLIVPNVGGFAGVSMRYSDAKVSFGYRADIFFGAMDGGLDTRREYDRTFYGPFATISIGLGG